MPTITFGLAHERSSRSVGLHIFNALQGAGRNLPNTDLRSASMYNYVTISYVRRGSWGPSSSLGIFRACLIPVKKEK